MADGTKRLLGGMKAIGLRFLTSSLKILCKGTGKPMWGGVLLCLSYQE